MRRCLVDEVATPAQEFYRCLETEFLPAFHAQKADAAQAIVAKRLAPLYETHRKAIEKLAEIANKANADCEKHAAQYVVSWAWRIGGFGLAGTLCAGGASIVIALSVARRLTRAAELMHDISQGDGDLRKRLDASGADELSELSAHFNVFAESIQNIIRNLKRQAAELQGSSTALQTVSESLAGGARRRRRLRSVSACPRRSG